MKADEPNESTNCPSTTWAYRRTSATNRAQSFVVKTCDEANVGLIFYQFINKTELENVKASCKNQGFKFVKKTTSPYGSIWLTYESKTHKIEFGSGLDDKDNGNTYMISFSKL